MCWTCENVLDTRVMNNFQVVVRLSGHSYVGNGQCHWPWTILSQDQNKLEAYATSNGGMLFLEFKPAVYLRLYIYYI